MGLATSLAAHVGGDLAKPEADFSLKGAITTQQKRWSMGA